MIAWLLLGLSFSSAEELPSYCASVPRASISRRYPIPSNVNYFIRSAPGTRRVGFATSDGNRLLDLETGKLDSLPGLIDPVPTPDGELIAIPTGKLYDPKKRKLVPVNTSDPSYQDTAPYVVATGGVVLERVSKEDEKNGILTLSLKPTKLTASDLRRRGLAYSISTMDFVRPSGAAVMSDQSVTDNYQSLGVLSRSGSQRKYRMLFESSGALKFRDYNYDTSSGRMGSAGPVAGLCSRSGVSGTLPVINKQGTQFSTYNFEAGHTQIYSIESRGAKCSVVDTIPALVGKVDFSPNNNLLAFHVDRGALASMGMGMFTEPGDGNKLGVYLFDRKRKAIVAVDERPSEDSYYPVFIDDQTIAFVSVKKTEGKREYFLNLAKVELPQNLACRNCAQDLELKNRIALLGTLYNDRCANQSGSRTLNQGVIGYSLMDSRRCLALVASLKAEELKQELALVGGDPTFGWKPENLAGLTIEKLKGYCQSAEMVGDGSPAPSVK